MVSSIKAKIILFYIIVLFFILSVLGISLYFSLNKIVYKSVDAGLLAKAEAIASLIDIDRNDISFNLSEEIMWQYRSSKSGNFFQVRRGDGTTMAKSTSLGATELPLAENDSQTQFTTIRLNGRHARLINFRNISRGGNGSEENKLMRGLVIQCAEDIENQLDLMDDFRTVLLGAVLFTMSLSAFGGFLIARKALAPVMDISETIDGISEHDLSRRVPLEGIPPELRILANSFNRTFERVEEAFNKQKRFAADASHELRTPLSVILSHCEITLRKERTAEEYKDSLSAVVKAAHAMSSTVRKLLTLARLGSDKVELKIETVDLKELISDATRLLGPLADDKGVRIDTSPISASLLIQGDREKLLELFTNLVDNAVKYNVPHGEVHITARKEAEFVLCEITDTGIGIPDVSLDKIFDRFYRVDHSRSKEIEGSGLGLSICQEIAALHGGKIEIKNKERNGTIVSVYLKEYAPRGK